MDNELKDILDKQISVQKYIPTEDDIVEHSCLFTYSHSGSLEYKSHKNCCIPRVLELAAILKRFSVKNTSILFYTHDYTRDYEDSINYVLCFGKKATQSFITIPNNHLTNGTVDYFLNEVRMNDIHANEKLNQSLFAGGPNGGMSGSRSQYVFSGLDNAKHKVVLTNFALLNIKEQLKFLYLINIDGNGMCYDRLYWQLASNSVPVYLQKNIDIVQLHDSLLIPSIHYIESDISSWPQKFETLAEDNDINAIIKNGKAFISKHFGICAKDKCNQIIKYCIEQISRKQNED